MATEFSEEEENAILAQRRLLKELEKAAFSKLPPLPDPYEEFWANIRLSDGWISGTLVVRPKPITVEDLRDLGENRALRTFESRPLIIYFHAGGFAAGTPPQVLLTARHFAMEFDATVLCPSYRLLPEHPWPRSTQDGMELVQRIAANQSLHYGANLADGFMIAGSSAGGCIASSVVALISAYPQEYPVEHAPTALYVSVPLLLVESIVPAEFKSMWTSSTENAEYTGLESVAIDSVLTKLLPQDYKSPWFSPVNLLVEALEQSKSEGASNSLAGLARNHPPTYIQANAKDPLRDDALIYEKLLTQLGISTQLRVFPDDAHLSFSTLSLLIPGKSRDPTLEEGTMEGVAWLLKRKWPSTRSKQHYIMAQLIAGSVTSAAASSGSGTVPSDDGTSLYPNSNDTSP